MECGILQNDTKNKPLRMVKTLLYELCRNMGSQALEQLECIPAIKENPSALIRTYVSTNVASLQDGQEAKGVSATSFIFSALCSAMPNGSRRY